jgi:DNA topoisomerase-1
MEDSLDLIASGQKVWHELCREVYTEIELLTAKLPPSLAIADSEHKQAHIKIDAEHTYLVGKYGPVIKYIKSGSDLTLFKNLKPGLIVDIARLKAGEYTLDELIITDEDKNKDVSKSTSVSSGVGKVIGLFKDHQVVLKTGKYGPYLEYGNEDEKKKKSLNLPLKNGKSDIDDICLMDVIDLLEEASTASSSSGNTFVRKISEDMTIRKGQYGDYIMYKTKKMVKPSFLKLKGFNGDYKIGDLNVLKVWIKETYNV